MSGCVCSLMNTVPLSAGVLSTYTGSSSLLLSVGVCWLNSGGGEIQIIIPRSRRYWPATKAKKIAHLKSRLLLPWLSSKEPRRHDKRWSVQVNTQVSAPVLTSAVGCDILLIQMSDARSLRVNSRKFMPDRNSWTVWSGCPFITSLRRICVISSSCWPTAHLTPAQFPSLCYQCTHPDYRVHCYEHSPPPIPQAALQRNTCESCVNLCTMLGWQNPRGHWH